METPSDVVNVVMIYPLIVKVNKIIGIILYTVLIKLQLKKADQKRSKFTLNVSADDRNIEKKDKNLNEPIQFYTGKSPMLYEIVVNTEEKNEIKGYLSTPKNAPQQISMP